MKKKFISITAKYKQNEGILWEKLLSINFQFINKKSKLAHDLNKGKVNDHKLKN